MIEKGNRGRFLGMMACMAAAAAVCIGLETMEAQAYPYANVRIFEDQGKKYLFLPSWADAEEEAGRYQGEGVTVMQSENLPNLEVDTASGSLAYVCQDKGNTDKGNLRVTMPDGTQSYEGVIAEWRTRGNSTWTLDKKAFQLKLSVEADLLGMGAAKTWILLANGFDETGIRNTIALRMAADAGLSFTPECRPVDLYCNGEYQGNYLLCEKIQVGEERVDIGEGFLVERELQDRYEVAVYLEGRKGFVTERGDCYLIENPKEPTAEQEEWIGRLIQQAEDAVFSGDGIHPVTGKHWSEYLDRDSFVRKYLLEEVTKNYDGGVTSAFYYVPEGEKRIYAGPAWDYDAIFGNFVMDEMNSNPEGVTELADHIFGSDLYSALMQQEDFRREVFSCFERVYQPLLEKLLAGGIDELAAQTERSVEMDHVRWREMDNRHQYYESYEDNLRYLKYFVEKRLRFLQEVWVDGLVYRTVTLRVEGSDWRKFYVKDGALLGDVPVPFLNDRLFIGWYGENGRKYDPYRPVYEDMTFGAKWQEIAQ